MSPAPRRTDHTPATRLKLVVPASDFIHRHAESHIPEQPQPTDNRLSDSPPRPSYSPLRAAISILQLQRQQAIKDMRNLERMKQAALQEPEAFVEDLRAGKLSQPPPSGVDVDTDLDDDGDDMDGNGESRHNRELDSTSVSRFGTFPTAQNVVRCPPIEWSKYHVVGHGLDRLHEHQRRFPGSNYSDLQSQQSQPHVIAAPYRPFSDTLDLAPLTTKHQRKDK